MSWRSARGRERLLQLCFLVPAIAYTDRVFGYPVVKNVVMAFQQYTTATFYTGEAPWVGFDNYVAVIGSSVFRQGGAQHGAVHGRPRYSGSS